MKTMSIEELLTWAFTQELWKVGSGGGASVVPGSAWSMISDFAALGTLIDRTPNAFGVLPGFEEGEAHADAMTVGLAVKALAAHEGYEIGEGWHPMKEFDDPHGLIAAEVERVIAEHAVRSQRIKADHVVNMVISGSILGRRPDWAVEPPDFEMVSRGGKPCWFVSSQCVDVLGRSYSVETDGFDQRKQRPKPGAYRKFKLVEPLRSCLLARLDWQLWQDALETLHGSLSGRLANHALRPFYADRQPWMHAEFLVKIA